MEALALLGGDPYGWSPPAIRQRIYLARKSTGFSMAIDEGELRI